MLIEVQPIWWVREDQPDGPAHLTNPDGFACGAETGDETHGFERRHGENDESLCPACKNVADGLPIGPLFVDTENLL